jgi:hypothetical protein
MPSFLKDILGSLASLRYLGSFPEHPEGGFSEDAKNLRGDWYLVGNDMRVAIKKERMTRKYSLPHGQ